MLLSLHILQLLYFATRIATLIRVMGYMDNNQRQMLLVKGTGEIICFKEYKLGAQKRTMNEYTLRY